MKKKIYYYDTDCGGVVYYANYLKYLEEARTEYFASKGFSIKDLAEGGTMFVVARLEIDYKFPARYGDTLEVNTWVSRTGGARIEFDAEIKNQNNQTIVKAKTILVCIGKDFKPKLTPEEIKKVIA
ncbi:MAG: thioesterase family protein [Candidatus Omnitrophica bacterium]|nr:thioesterase family protein [Candidatus Omnitrophota bacterium]